MVVGVLGFVVGAGSLVVTLVLERANRRELVRRDIEAAKAVDRDRWMESKAEAYAEFSALLYAWFDDLNLRIRPDSDDAYKRAAGENYAMWRKVQLAKGTVQLFGPQEVRDAVDRAVTILSLFSGESIGDDIEALDAEQQASLASLDVMLLAMRRDLRVTVDG